MSRLSTTDPTVVNDHVQAVAASRLPSMVPGSGIRTAAGAGAETFCAGSVVSSGGVVKTQVLIDLTGLNSSTAGDIIGINSAANCYLFRWLTSVNGTWVGGKITCLEAPTGGEPDIDVFAANESTGTEDAAVSGLTETSLQDSGADYTLGLEKYFTAGPTNGQYIYLVSSGGGDNATYTAGKFLIELYGKV